jgi:hypothetical protein
MQTQHKKIAANNNNLIYNTKVIKLGAGLRARTHSLLLLLYTLLIFYSNKFEFNSTKLSA